MTKRSAALLAALCTFGVLVAGCVIPADDPLADPTFDEDPTPTQSDDPNKDTMEGTYEYDTMDLYVDAVLEQHIEPWVRATWPGLPLPYVYYVPNGESGPERCADSTGQAASYTSHSYEYCPGDNTVYVGQNTLWEFYTETGDAGPAVGLAHEFGHHIQHELGVPSPRTADQSVRYENQADCLAGAWTAFVNDRGNLELPDDLEDLDRLFPIIGSAEGPDRDHGTAEERRAAFDDGFDGGPSACGIRT